MQSFAGQAAHFPHVLDFSGGLDVHVTVSKEHVVLSVPLSSGLVEKDCAIEAAQMRGASDIERLH
jgi:hypothetical protein